MNAPCEVLYDNSDVVDEKFATRLQGPQDAAAQSRKDGSVVKGQRGTQTLDYILIVNCLVR